MKWNYENSSITSSLSSSLSPEEMDGGIAFLQYMWVTQHGLNDIWATIKTVIAGFEQCLRLTNLSAHLPLRAETEFCHGYVSTT